MLHVSYSSSSFSSSQLKWILAYILGWPAAGQGLLGPRTEHSLLQQMLNMQFYMSRKCSTIIQITQYVHISVLISLDLLLFAHYALCYCRHVTYVHSYREHIGIYMYAYTHLT